MKNKEIWLVMAVIVAVGVSITVFNSKFITKQETASTTAAYALATEETVAGVTEEFKIAGAAAGQADGRAVRGIQEQEEVGEDQDVALEEETVSEIRSPLETAEETEDAAKPAKADVPQVSGAPKEKRSIVQEETIVNYRSRLDEVDLQIQRIRSEGTESTTYSMKTAAENELKLWDNELNAIYNDILPYLDEEQTKELVSEERAWMKERDAKAVEAAKKSAGGTLEGLEYTASLADSTKERAYELVERYEQVTK